MDSEGAGAASERTPARRPAPAQRPIVDVIRDRWSARAIDAERAVAPSQVATLLEAARWAPSNGNAQPWRYLVFDDTVAEARVRARECLRPRNDWAWQAPVLLLSIVHRYWPDSDEVNPTALHDVDAASMALCLQATAEGLVCHQMAGFDRERTRRVFALPPDADPVAFVAIGYPGRIAELEPSRRQRELRDRRRRPVNETAFVGGYDGPGFET
jgi:nitroreductase